MADLRWALECDETDAAVVDALAGCLCRLWSGGGGEYGVYTVASERERMRHLLVAFLHRARLPEAQ